ncbi:polysaccharide pyruvyl transferase family protein [Cobetia marina]|uniref:polysaccharide pyruvyl transferase family protein n=1 Tax=Cobetia marina TaxID=28258 RepID=UPI0026E3C0C5|nr:polysaccharide pyruvyl transferase family protein [Cobetia marina]MDO6786116.1 polysaccharide pyruvyl transferase family protein [Cobetia marina]
MAKICMTHGWHDDNKGDSAILMGTIDFLDQLIDAEHGRSDVSGEGVAKAEGHRIDILPIDDQVFATERGPFRHIRRRYRERVTVGQPLMPPMRDKLRFVTSLLGLGAKMAFGKQGKSGNDVIDGADLVVVKGGHIFHNGSFKKTLSSWLALIGYLAPVMLARKAGKRVLLLGHSFGPFKTPAQERFFLRTLSDCLVVSREEITHAMTQKADPKLPHALLGTDMAFAMAPRASDEHAEVKAPGGVASPYAVITLRDWWGLDQQAFAERVEVLSRSLLESRERLGIERLMIVPHVLGPTDIENDQRISQLVFDHLQKALAAADGGEELATRIELVQGDPSPDALVDLYRDAEFLVGTRFHSVIFALMSGTPVYALSYCGPKAPGIMRDFGLGDSVQDIENFDPARIVADIEALVADKAFPALAERVIADKLAITADITRDFLRRAPGRAGVWGQRELKLNDDAYPAPTAAKAPDATDPVATDAPAAEHATHDSEPVVRGV